jgi:hypothetical protein
MKCSTAFITIAIGRAEVEGFAYEGVGEHGLGFADVGEDRFYPVDVGE